MFEINLRSDVGVYMWTQVDLGYLCGPTWTKDLYVDPISKFTQFDDDDDDESMIVIEIVKELIFNNNYL